MRARFSSHLYIRVDRPLRDDINKAAERAGLSVSTFARQALRSVLDGAAARDDGRGGASPAARG